MPRYALIKHYRGVPADFPPMSTWTPDDVRAHVDYMERFADKLRASGEFVDSLALSEEAELITADGSTRAVPASKALVAGWMLIDVPSARRARELAAELAAAPGKDGVPLREWLELRPAYGAPMADDEGETG